MIVRRASQLLFFGALLLVSFLLGSATDGGKQLIAAAATAYHGVRLVVTPPPAVRLRDDRYTDVAASDAAMQRVRLLAPTLAGPVLITGGRHRFVDRCPGFVGCVALEYDRHGRFVHAYPFRPEAYEAVLVPNGLAEPVGYGRPLGFDFAEHTEVFHVDSYSNGDLAVVLFAGLSWPPFVGIARIDRDGRPRWFRADDGSHHWLTITHGGLRGVGAGLQDALVAPGYRVGEREMPGEDENIWLGKLGDLTCTRHLIEHLYVIDGDGALLQRIAVEDAVRDSRHAPVLGYSNNPCGPLHLNSVDVLPADGPYGLAAGDFLVSLRGISGLAVLDGRDGQVKRIWRGSFYGQHGARVLAPPAAPASAFLLYDNWGFEDGYGPGRLLSVDVRSGRERTVFPNPSSPATVQLRSHLRGGVSVAPDGSRAIVFATEAGQAVEVDLASGATTAVFQSLDDVSTLEDAAEQTGQAYRWSMSDIRYVATASGRAASS